MEGMGMDEEQQRMEEEKRSAELERRNNLLKNYTTPEARERISRIRLVKPEKVRDGLEMATTYKLKSTGSPS